MKLHIFRRAILTVILSTFSLNLIACAVKNESPKESPSSNANAQATAAGTMENRNASGDTKPNGETGDSSPAEFEGTTGGTARAKFEVAPALLREVRTARQNSFDRVVFEFEGKEIPNYRIRYTDKPDPQCGSGDAVQMTEGGLLQVTFESTNAHTEAGQPTVTDRERRLNLPVLKELRFTCDFEAQVIVVLGSDSRQPYRVLDLYNPTRVVVDIKH